MVIAGSMDAGDGSSPHAALAQFYHAFNHRDPELMAENWLRAEHISMANPLGGLRRGWQEIHAVYDRIFNGPACVYVEFHDFSLHAGGDIFVAAGRERGVLRIGDSSLELRIRTTRIYQLESNRWKQVHHHGSIDDPDLLSAYQRALSMN